MTTTAPSTATDAAALAAFGPLRRAELLLVQACQSGDIAKVGLRRPELPSSHNTLRAAFVSFVLRGGLALRARRLQVLGAFIEGRLDLGNADIAGSLWFFRCTFDSPVLLDGARVAGGVALGGCRLRGLLAENCEIAADLALNAGCTVDDDVRLGRARIGGQLDCSRLELGGGHDPSSSSRSLLADAARVGGDVRLTERFKAAGEVRFVGARVGGDFLASGHFNGDLVPEGGRGSALLLDRIAVAGSLQLDSGFGAAGCVSLRRARIGGDFDATGASFDWLGDASWGNGASLALDRARIDGALILRDLRSPLLGASFVGAKVGSLADDVTTWGQRLALDGFTYSRFGDGAPLDTVFRVDWLERQDPAHLRGQFRVQPWRRLIRVLRRMGHDRRAGSIAVRRERWLRRIGWVGSWAPPALRWLPRAGHALLGALAGYGYRPFRLVGWLAGVWLLCSGAYWAATEFGGATLTALSADAGFSPFGYSLALLLPLVSSAETAVWAASGSTWTEALRWLSRLETGFGWMAVVLLLASLAGWVDRDRR